MISESVRRRVVSGGLSHVDAHFSELLCRLAPDADPRIANVFAELCHALTRQHSCISLDELEAGVASELAALSIVSTIVSEASSETPKTPLVIDGNRLYMQRYYQYERRIAEDLVNRNHELDNVDMDAVATAIDATFDTSAEGPDWQKVAALQALTRGLTIITGGPGTGKTTTVVKILAAIASLAGEELPIIKLAAPTGKAAMRLMETLRGAELPFDPEVQTLHRLLGMHADGRGYRHGPNFPIAADLLIVDEVSMIDLAMMHRLLGALPDNARVILLGDPGQLPSVEAGNILADICQYPAGYSPDFVHRAGQIGITLTAADGGHRLVDAISELTVSYRFSPDKGIGRLSQAMRAAESVSMESDDEVSFDSLSAFTNEEMARVYQDYFDAIEKGTVAESLLNAFDKARILTPIRDGQFGVAAINETIESNLAKRGLIPGDSVYYRGRPILVTRNDYNLKLFNGDVGVCVDDEQTGEPLVVFRDTKGEPRSYLASRLPAHETCFAMTVHKSQGSEFDHVVLVIPPPLTAASEQMMTRELVYTAVTRARHRVSLYFDDDALTKCLANRTTRSSGLGDRLITATPPAKPEKPESEVDPRGQLDLF